MRGSNILKSRMLKLALFGAMTIIAPLPAISQQAGGVSEPICTPRPVSAVFASVVELLLTPGEAFSIDQLSPNMLQEVGAIMADAEKRRAQDWADLCHYAEENAELLATHQKPHIVFMGDSITEYWKPADPGLFRAAKVDRGISGQTTPQMLLRMYPDVIRLGPRIVHIMAGTNDISGNTGPISDEAIVDNIRAMIVLAKANQIKVVLGSITPSSGFVMRPGLNPADRIARVNSLLRQLATEQAVTFVDYHTPMADGAGGLRRGLANDGLHPNRHGYAVMRPLLEKAIAQADRRRR